MINPHDPLVTCQTENNSVGIIIIFYKTLELLH